MVSVNAAEMAGAQPLPGISGRRRHREPAIDGFTQEIETLLPGLRRYARYLTRDAAAADDLVQETVARGIEKIHLWREGTDLRAWLSAILHNLHISGVRKTLRNRAMMQQTYAQASRTGLPHQIAWLELRDLEWGLATLPEGQRSVVVLVGLGGERYETIAARLGIPLGTVRSRLSRGRTRLRELIGGEPLQRPSPRETRRRPAA